VVEVVRIALDAELAHPLVRAPRKARPLVAGEVEVPLDPDELEESLELDTLVGLRHDPSLSR
jgi:hypothetical protein